jgi:hypothetical protein
MASGVRADDRGLAAPAAGRGRVTRTAPALHRGRRPAGLLLGLLLAKRGAEVIVLEGHETFEREFRGEVLQPSTAHLLDELGLLGYILEQPHSRLTSGHVRVSGRTVGEFSFARIAPDYPYAIWMPQPIFLEALRTKAAPFPTFQCWMGARVTGLIEEGAGRREGAPGQGTLRGPGRRGGGGRDGASPRCAGWAASRSSTSTMTRRHLVRHRRTPGWPSTIYISPGAADAGTDPPEVSARTADGAAHAPARLAALARRAWRRWPTASGASTSIFKGFAEGLTDFTPSFRQERSGSVRVGPRWPPPDRRCRAHRAGGGAIGVNGALHGGVAAT